MKQTHLLRNSYRFLIDLVYPNRCPCCNQVIAWDAWICEACQIETALNPDTICSGCGKPFDDCMCSESLAFEGAMAVSRYEGRARQGILQLKQAENLNFANYTGAVLGERILQKPDWMMADAIVPVPMQQHQWILRGKNPAERIAIRRTPFLQSVFTTLSVMSSFTKAHTASKPALSSAERGRSFVSK